MILNILTVAMLLTITGLWCTSQKGRGFFSSFLNMVSVVAAGAIAFGVWEPLTMLILENAGGQVLVERIAPTAALLVPFCISLAILRLSVDAFVSRNVDFDDATNFIGGMVCGVLAATVTAGTVVVGLNFLGVGKTLFGHDYIENDSGNLVYSTNLWVPVDKITVALYERLSTAGFASSTPLARFAPDIHEQAALSRMIYATETEDATRYGRSSFVPGGDGVRIAGRMTVVGDLQNLLSDRWFPDRNQNLRGIDGELPKPNSTAELIFLEADAASIGEETGQIIFTPGQLRLIAINNDDRGIAIHPHAVFAANGTGAQTLTRFRFDDTNEQIASPGRGGRHVFAFEFLLPPGYSPESLIVRNIRKSLKNSPRFPETGEAIAGASERDQSISGGQALAALNLNLGGIDLPPATGTPIASENPTSPGSAIQVSAVLPNRFGISLNNERGLTLAEQRRGRSSSELVIRSGRGEFSVGQIEGAFRSSGSVATSFEQPDGLRGIMIPLKKRGSGNPTVYGQAIQQIGTSAQPLLYNSQTNKYFEAIGFLHVSAGNLVTIQFDFARPIRNMSSELPSLQMTGDDTAIYLVYMVDETSQLTDFVLKLDAEAAPRIAVNLSPPVRSIR
jgi:hypothetical protein